MILKYPWYEYPIIICALIIYVKAWKFWKLKETVNAHISWRKSIGMFPKDYTITFKDYLSFGHWLVRQWFLEKMVNKYQVQS